MANKNKDTKKKEKKVANGLSSELKKVIWPTPKQLFTNTSAVIVIVLITVAIVFVLDFIFEKANTFGVNQVKAAIGVTETNSEDANSEENTTEGTESTDVISVDSNTVAVVSDNSQE